ncbi:MAG: hypothetical protein SVV67_08450 [Bacillota bacterium]|nr:hypothetical protein [Bacillota bacterium]
MDRKENITLSMTDEICSAEPVSGKSCCASNTAVDEVKGPFGQRLMAVASPA